MKKYYSTRQDHEQVSSKRRCTPPVPAVSSSGSVSRRRPTDLKYIPESRALTPDLTPAQSDTELELVSSVLKSAASRRRPASSDPPRKSLPPALPSTLTLKHSKTSEAKTPPMPLLSAELSSDSGSDADISWATRARHVETKKKTRTGVEVVSIKVMAPDLLKLKDVRYAPIHPKSLWHKRRSLECNMELGSALVRRPKSVGADQKHAGGGLHERTQSGRMRPGLRRTQSGDLFASRMARYAIQTEECVADIVAMVDGDTDAAKHLDAILEPSESLSDSDSSARGALVPTLSAPSVLSSTSLSSTSAEDLSKKRGVLSTHRSCELAARSRSAPKWESESEEKMHRGKGSKRLSTKSDTSGALVRPRSLATAAYDAETSATDVMHRRATTQQCAAAAIATTDLPRKWSSTTPTPAPRPPMGLGLSGVRKHRAAKGKRGRPRLGHTPSVSMTLQLPSAIDISQLTQASASSSELQSPHTSQSPTKRSRTPMGRMSQTRRSRASTGHSAPGTLKETIETVGDEMFSLLTEDVMAVDTSERSSVNWKKVLAAKFVQTQLRQLSECLPQWTAAVRRQCSPILDDLWAVALIEADSELWKKEEMVNRLQKSLLLAATEWIKFESSKGSQLLVLSMRQSAKTDSFTEEKRRHSAEEKGEEEDDDVFALKKELAQLKRQNRELRQEVATLRSAHAIGSDVLYNIEDEWVSTTPVPSSPKTQPTGGGRKVAVGSGKHGHRSRRHVLDEARVSGVDSQRSSASASLGTVSGVSTPLGLTPPVGTLDCATESASATEVSMPLKTKAKRKMRIQSDASGTLPSGTSTTRIGEDAGATAARARVSSTGRSVFSSLLSKLKPSEHRTSQHDEDKGGTEQTHGPAAARRKEAIGVLKKAVSQRDAGIEATDEMKRTSALFPGFPLVAQCSLSESRRLSHSSTTSSSSTSSLPLRALSDSSSADDLPKERVSRKGYFSQPPMSSRAALSPSFSHTHEMAPVTTTVISRVRRCRTVPFEAQKLAYLTVLKMKSPLLVVGSTEVSDSESAALSQVRMYAALCALPSSTDCDGTAEDWKKDKRRDYLLPALALFQSKEDCQALASATPKALRSVRAVAFQKLFAAHCSAVVLFDTDTVVESDPIVCTDLLSQGRHSAVEFKKATICLRSTESGKRLICIVNSRGGFLLLAADSSEERYDWLTAIQRLCRRRAESVSKRKLFEAISSPSLETVV